MTTIRCEEEGRFSGSSSGVPENEERSTLSILMDEKWGALDPIDLMEEKWGAHNLFFFFSLG